MSLKGYDLRGSSFGYFYSRPVQVFPQSRVMFSKASKLEFRHTRLLWPSAQSVKLAHTIYITTMTYADIFLIVLEGRERKVEASVCFGSRTGRYFGYFVKSPC